MRNIEDAYDMLCALHELDEEANEGEDKSKELALWYKEFGNAEDKESEELDAVLAISNAKYISKFLGVDTSKRLKLVRKYLPKLKEKWEAIQKEEQ